MQLDKTILPLLILSILFMASLSAQTPERCWHDHKMAEAMAQYPEYAAQFDKEGNPVPLQDLPEQGNSSVVTIPVHVIIVHPPGQSVGTGDNLSLARIESQIDVLNEDFRRTNADAVNTPPEFPADDSEIEFCLAAVDPSGNPTDGVTRYPTTLSLASNEFQIKQATTWNRNQYLNIWVGPNVGALGWAYLPTTGGLPNPVLDGVVVETGAFGGPGFATMAPYDLGRTATHEVGHYLGLRHVWGNAGCNNDDNIADTPVQDDNYFGCPNHPQFSCGSNDMFMNYMDYVNDACMNSFSTGQGDYMQLILNTSRSSLLNSATTNCSLIPPLAVQLISLTDALCNGQASGSVEVEALGGQPGYLYSIDGGPAQATGLFTGLFPGPHFITITDANNNITSIDITIGEPPILEAFQTGQVDPSCFDSTDGFLSADAIGGTPGYLFSLDGGPAQANGNFPQITGGFHTITVQDANNCFSFLNINLPTPPPIVTITQETQDVLCNGEASGQIVLLAGGGTPSYLYATDGFNFQTNGIFGDLPAGEYTITVQDANNCEAVFAGIAVEEPDSLILELTIQENILCFGDTSATVLLDGEGGTGAYQFALDTFPFGTDSLFENLRPDSSYLFQVEDENGCLTTETLLFTQPDSFYIDTLSLVQPGCGEDSTGIIFLEAAGGAPSYLYFFNNDTTGVDTAFFDSLSTGVYSIRIVDTVGCEIKRDLVITQAADIEIEVDSLQNVSCYQGEDGFIQLHAMADTSQEFQYRLNGGPFQDNAYFPDLAAGMYTLTVQDSSGCQRDTFIELLQPDTFLLLLDTLVSPPCAGQDGGSLQLSANGGNGGDYTYSLNGETNSNGLFEDLPAGDYLISVEDKEGCGISLSATLPEPEELILEVDALTSSDCNLPNAAVQLSGTGGQGDFSFTLGDSTNTSGLFENLPPGNYFPVLTDANNCTDTLALEVTTTDAIEISNPLTQAVSCAGAADGVLEFAAQGGAGNYTYTLDGNTNDTGLFEDLSGGDYQLEVVDTSGCTASLTVSLVEPAPLDLMLETLTPAGCDGTSGGSVQFSASGGSGNYLFSLPLEENNTGSFEELSAGNYLAILTDQNNCQDTLEVEITFAPPVELNLDNTQETSCTDASDGQLQVTASGGTGSFTYSLDNQTNDSGLFTGLSAGTYEITATDEAGCTESLPATIGQPQAIELILDDVQEADCNVANDGALQVSASGGAGNFTYILDGQSNTNGFFEGLTPGDYLVEAIDANDCTAEILVSVPGGTPFKVEDEIVNNISCVDAADAAVQLEVTGQPGSFTFTWDDQENNNGFFSGFSAGTYSFTVTDADGCSVISEVMVPNPPELLLSAEVLNEPACFGEASGQIQLEGAGGTGQITYTLDGDQSNQSGLFSGLPAGSYELVATDANGCSINTSLQLDQPQLLSTDNINVQPVSCSGDADGQVDVQVAGGTGPFTYTLAGQENSTGLFTQLSSGDYMLNITDANGCQLEEEIMLEEPPALNLLLVSVEAGDCAANTGGTVEVTASGGTPGYTFELNGESNTSGVFDELDPAGYTVFVTDAGGCVEATSFVISSGGNLDVQIENLQDVLCAGDASGSIQGIALGGDGNYIYSLNGVLNDNGFYEGLSVGNYNLAVQDDQGCWGETQFSISEPAAISLELDGTTPASCFGAADGSAQLSAAGGNGGFTYEVPGFSSDTGQFDELLQGDYQATITDANGCTESLTFIINGPPEILLQETENQEVSCFGFADGSIQLFASGGTGGFTYILDNESNASGAFDQLLAGSYTAQVTDQTGCTTEIPVEVGQPTELVLTLDTLIAVACQGEDSGLVELSAEGGIPDYTFLLDGSLSADGTFPALAAGNYTATVQDQNSCETNLAFAVTEPAALELSFELVQAISCFGASDGTLQLEAAGGTPVYSYSLEGDISADGQFSGLSAGTYDAEVEDANGCLSLLSISLEEPEELTFSLTDMQEDTGTGNGSLSVEASGGTPPYLYSLDGENFSASNTFEDLTAGEYTLFVEDANACLSELSGIVDLNTALSGTASETLSLSFYPNPFEDELFLELDLSGAADIQLEVHSMEGRLVSAFEFQLSSGLRQQRIELGKELPSGCYFAVVRIGGFRKVVKLVKM
jgi:hypothetical protein